MIAHGNQIVVVLHIVGNFVELLFLVRELAPEQHEQLRQHRGQSSTAKGFEVDPADLPILHFDRTAEHLCDALHSGVEVRTPSVQQPRHRPGASEVHRNLRRAVEPYQAGRIVVPAGPYRSQILCEAGNGLRDFPRLLNRLQNFPRDGGVFSYPLAKSLSGCM